ncbi:MAG: hypothetical protein R3B70_18985 [Polyangiaceae bacterium]
MSHPRGAPPDTPPLRRGLLALTALLTLPLTAACAPSPLPQHGPAPDVSALFPPPVTAPLVTADATPAMAIAPTSTSADSPCQTDNDCGYDPTEQRCGTNPAFNKQPPVIDQGIICYCAPPPQTATLEAAAPATATLEAAAPATATPPTATLEAASCALLRVEPVPCEGDHSCAVLTDPRPHPVRADAAHPHEKRRACRPPKKGAPRRTDRFTTCERTNICTLHTRECDAR